MTYGIGRFFLLFLACCWPSIDAGAHMRIVRQWAELDFAFPDESVRQSAIDKGFYIPGNTVPIDTDVDYGQGESAPRIFVTAPRTSKGCPISLGTVDEQGRIFAYPDYSWHDNQGQNCDGLTSAFRVAIDQCNRLWVIDSGQVAGHQYCVPQLLAFDLATDELIYRHRFNQSTYTDASLLVNLAMDVRPSDCPDDCEDTYVYVADETGFALDVVDVKNNRSWKVTHRLFYPDPASGTFTIDGESFDRMDGNLAMAVSPYKRDEERYLYLHALSATTENVVRTSYLRNASFIENPAADPKAINEFPGKRPNQSAAEAMDSNGVLYFGLMDPPSIWCWNSATEFSPRNFHLVAEDQETLQFASGVKIVKTPKGEEELWVLTDSFQRSVSKTLSPDEINFRIHSVSLANFTCGSPPKDQSMGYQANVICPN